MGRNTRDFFGHTLHIAKAILMYKGPHSRKPWAGKLEFDFMSGMKWWDGRMSIILRGKTERGNFVFIREGSVEEGRPTTSKAKQL